ncbi:cytochrome c biogenesis Fc [Iris pallida]|uniref:Cytochrome c biogenesis Fc (Mitochondrion) n=1 Tax=Iris pallida TaxID=29817 RepID=A0AAX6I8W3_IRIPA|nr:cytochrome c biogenesis Fc [Iris pallida]
MVGNMGTLFRYALRTLSFILSVSRRSENRTDRADGPTTELLLFHYFHGRASWHGSTRTIEMVRQ